jgi:exodeoxyribonuclease VII large subunit
VETDSPQVWSVHDLTARVKESLESGFRSVWVGGEISNFSRPQSGHCYFTLKDDRAQIRAVVWRTAASRLRFDLHDGLEVICQGDIEVYAPRGTYQLVARRIEPRGVGALELALRKLKQRLEAEGLFDPRRKRPLPKFPRRVAFVTSPTGAAIRDFLEVLRRRWKGVDVLVVPTRVQGEGAAQEIADAIALVNRLADKVDCLVVGRGGGSLEDLWAFNEEPVVRAIHASRIPVIAAVGHEIDITLADLVADVRALTPSEAAELVVPASEEILSALGGQQKRLLLALRRRAAIVRARLDWLAGRRAFRKPFDRLHDAARRLDELATRSGRASRLRLAAARRTLDAFTAQLDSLSPLSVLGRGYSLTRRLSDGLLVRDAARLAMGDQLVTRFARGQAVSRVERIETEGDARD